MSTEVGAPMEPRNLNRHFANLRAAAGLPDVRLRDFRHTVVSMLMELGVQPHLVHAIAWHVDVKVTFKIYSHNQPGRDAPGARQARRAAVVNAVAVGLAVNSRPLNLATCIAADQNRGRGSVVAQDIGNPCLRSSATVCREIGNT
jgi:hypothetical protein